MLTMDGSAYNAVMDACEWDPKVGLTFFRLWNNQKFIGKKGQLLWNYYDEENKKKLIQTPQPE